MPPEGVNTMGLSQQHEDLSTEELFRRFAPFVARFLFRLGVRSDGLDDVVQDVFLVVHRRGGYKAGPAKPTSYLATIATNAASAYRRRQLAQHTRSSDTEVEKLVSTNKGPVQILETTERLRLLQAALDRLEPDFRSTLVLADIEGESCASIAASMGVPTGTVYWRLHEARKRFQRALRAEEAGIPARPISQEAQDEAASSLRERSLLAFGISPFWFLSGARRLLQAGAAQPQVHYDVLVGLERHRRFSSSMALPSWAPAEVVASAAAPSAGIGVLGLSGAGIAGAVAIVVSLLVHSKPPPVEGGQAGAQASARPLPAPTSVPDLAPPAATPAPLAPSPRAAPPVESDDRSADDVLPSGTGSSPHQLGRTPSSSSSSSSASTAPVTSVHTGEHPTPRPAPSDTSLAANETTTRPAPRPPSDDTASAVSDTALEAREIARAERMLSSNPAGALTLVRSARARFKPSFLPEERDYVEVMALQALGRTDEAKTAASRFLGAYPGGAFGDRVRRALKR